MEGPAPGASRLRRDKVTHPGALPRAGCALTRARSPRASDAGRRRRLRPSTSAGWRAVAGGGAGCRRVTWAGSAQAQSRCTAHPSAAASRAAPTLATSLPARVAVRLRLGGGRCRPRPFPRVPLFLPPLRLPGRRLRREVGAEVAVWSGGAGGRSGTPGRGPPPPVLGRGTELSPLEGSGPGAVGRPRAPLAAVRPGSQAGAPAAGARFRGRARDGGSAPLWPCPAER